VQLVGAVTSTIIISMSPGADGTGTETAPTSTARNLGQQEKQLFGHQPGSFINFLFVLESCCIEEDV
jgi:hypothetical protein